MCFSFHLTFHPVCTSSLLFCFLRELEWGLLIEFIFQMQCKENKFLTMLSHFYDEALTAPNADLSSASEVYTLESSPPGALGGTVLTHGLTMFISLCSEVACISKSVWYPAFTFICICEFISRVL